MPVFDGRQPNVSILVTESVWKIMLEKPDIQDEMIIRTLEEAYDLNVTAFSFLPLGADQHTAVYRVVSQGSTPYFVKLRLGDFRGITVTIPDVLSRNGIMNIIAPIATQQQQLWISRSRFTLALYPFVAGRNGYETELTAKHWASLGQTLRQLHEAQIPKDIAVHIPDETYSPVWREQLRDFLAQVEETPWHDPVSAEMVALLKSRRREIHQMAEQADRLGVTLKSRTTAHVLCHADIHAGNMLIDDSGKLYVIDWDTLVFAPRERDLMFVGGGLGGGWQASETEEDWFYSGYGTVAADPVLLTYYRYERIVQDIVAYCTQILLTTGDNPDRREGLRQLTHQFMPDEVIDIALRSETRLPEALRFRIG